MKKLFSLFAVVAGLAFAHVSTPAQITDLDVLIPNPRWQPRASDLTIFDTVVSNETVTIDATNRVPVAIPAGAIVGIELSAVASAAGTSNLVVKFNTSIDGSTWTTDEPFTFTMALTGTTAKRSAGYLMTNAPARYVSLDEITTTQTNFVTLSAAKLIFLPKP